MINSLKKVNKNLVRSLRTKSKKRLTRPNKETKPLKRQKRTRNKNYIKLSKTNKKTVFLLPGLTLFPPKRK